MKKLYRVITIFLALIISLLPLDMSKIEVKPLEVSAIETKESMILFKEPNLTKKNTFKLDEYDIIAPRSKPLSTIPNIVKETKKEIPKKEVKQVKKKAKKVKTSNGQTQTKSELQNYAHNLVLERGWTEYDFECLVKLWNKESGWNPNAHNKRSGAHGIPQSLPASKMASEGDDYYTNGYTQIRWGLKYIANRYGSPSGAWDHFLKKHWY